MNQAQHTVTSGDYLSVSTYQQSNFTQYQHSHCHGCVFGGTQAVVPTQIHSPGSVPIPQCYNVHGAKQEFSPLSLQNKQYVNTGVSFQFQPDGVEMSSPYISISTLPQQPLRKTHVHNMVSLDWPQQNEGDGNLEGTVALGKKLGYAVDSMAITGDVTETGSTCSVPQGGAVDDPHTSLKPMKDDGKKRALRLMKNREAARVCRQKKKEYLKCLENRVAMLESQNKTLIVEIKALKEICQLKAE